MKKLQNWVAYVANLFLVFVWGYVLTASEFNWVLICVCMLGITSCIENIGFRIKQVKDERD